MKSKRSAVFVAVSMVLTVATSQAAKSMTLMVA
jgi:hypothetical protein